MEIDTLKYEDIQNGFLETLEALRPTGLQPSPHLYWEIEEQLNLNTKSIIYVAREGDRVIGAATMLLEQKVIHNCGLVAHVEDVAVHKDHQGKGIGQALVRRILDDAKRKCCYKVILNCDASLIPFYEKCGFRQSAVQMRVDL